MGEIIAHLAMSLDGFIADPDDGCDELFGSYGSGDVAVKLGAGIPELHVSRKTADLTNGWNGHPGGEVPMVVVTHHPPPDWPRDGVPIFFEDWVETAIAKARALAGDQDVSIAGATITRGPVRLSGPAAIEDRGVTHLRYQVRKES
jgi:dihydrofolate reductase